MGIDNSYNRKMESIRYVLTVPYNTCEELILIMILNS